MTHQTKADESVPISEELRRRWGLKTGSRAVIRETPVGLLISPQDPPLGRVYIESTTACNLNCIGFKKKFLDLCQITSSYSLS